MVCCPCDRGRDPLHLDHKICSTGMDGEITLVPNPNEITEIRTLESDGSLQHFNGLVESRCHRL